MKVICFLSKKFCSRKWTILGPKMAHPQNSGSTLRMFLKFCAMKGANRYMEIILMAFQKKSCLAQMGYLRPKIARPHNSGSAVRTVLQCCTGVKRDMEIILMVFLKKKLIWICFKFFLILHNERGQEVHENFSCYFLRKNLIWGNLSFLGQFLLFDWAWSKLIQATVTIGSLNNQGMISFMITTGSLNSQDMISQLNVYVGYFMDIERC